MLPGPVQHCWPPTLFWRSLPACKVHVQMLAKEMAARDMAAIIDMTAVLRVQASFVILSPPQKPGQAQDDSCKFFLFVLVTHSKGLRHET